MSEHYTPPKIKSLGDDLRTHYDVQRVLKSLRESYSSLASYNTAINRLRAYLIATEERHPDYPKQIQNIENHFVEAYSKTHDNDENQKALLACIRFIHDFKGVPIKRQLCLRKKIQRDEISLPSPELKDHVLSLDILPSYVRDLQLTQSEHIAIKKQTAESQKKKASDVFILQTPNTLVKRCTDILKNKESSLEHVGVALALLTGRRTVEILLTGTLDPIIGNQHFAYFSGQVKTGLQSVQTVNDDCPRCYAIPLLAPFKLINQQLLWIQNQVKNLLPVNQAQSREKINHKFSPKLSRAVKDIITSDTRFHDLRTLYALISYEAFKPHTYGINGWVGKVLGHCQINVSTHYTRMQLGKVDHIGNIPTEFDS